MAPTTAIDTEAMTASSRVEGSDLVVVLKGNADHQTAEKFADFITHIHTACVQAAVTGAVLDVRNLEFMNSSCFKALVTWVSDIQEMDPAKRYKIRVYSNASIPWQKRSLHSLMYFAVDLVSVEYPT